MTAITKKEPYKFVPETGKIVVTVYDVHPHFGNENKYQQDFTDLKEAMDCYNKHRELAVKSGFASVSIDVVLSLNPTHDH